MATASKIQLSPAHRPVYAVPNLQQASADKASELLQRNHDLNHMYFNSDGFHNHVVHHLLSIYALGASPAELEKAYKENASYQLPAMAENEHIVQDMGNKSTFYKYIGNRDHFPDYLRYFKDQIEQKGWQDVVQTWLFDRTETADDMLVRLFAGFVHPLIHLGFGVEFDQPAIIAESLASVATHDTWIGKFLIPAEKAAQARDPNQPSKTLKQLLHEGAKSSTLVGSIRDSDGNKLREGVIGRAGEEMAALAGQWTVKPDELEAKCAEMLDFDAYTTFAPQRVDKEVRMDFFLMHHTNCAVFFPYLLFHPNMSWLAVEDKARLLEWKGRSDLAQFVARGTPELLADEVDGYIPKHADASANATNGAESSMGEGVSREWAGIFKRANLVHDDGHVPKLVRAVKAGEEFVGKVGVKDGMVKPGSWVKMGYMTMDSTEGAGQKWLRTTGLDSAWTNIPARKSGHGAVNGQSQAQAAL